MISLITATGNRKEAFALCESYIKAQTYKGPLQWLVVEDCNEPSELNMGQERFRGPKDWKEGINTQRLNLDVALKYVKGDIIFIIEDDDYYSPTYLQTHIDLMKTVGVVGEARSKYFNVRVPGWKIMNNLKHSSLAQTSFRSAYLPLFEKAVNSGNLYIDIDFWGKVEDAGVPSLLVNGKNLCIGIKGMPGRDGISPGHKSKDFMFDPEFRILKNWIGNDADPYFKLYKESKK